MQFKLITAASITLITVSNLLISSIWAHPGNRHKYDCYDKNSNTFKFGSPNNISSRSLICIPNPHLRRSSASTGRNRPSTSTTNRTRRTRRVGKDYRYVSTNRYRYKTDNSGLTFGLGLLGGAIISDIFRPNWWYGGVYPGDFVYVGDTFIGDIGDVDIGDVDLGDVDLGDIDIGDIGIGDEIEDDFYRGDYDFDSNELNDDDHFDLDKDDFADADDFVDEDYFDDADDFVGVDMDNFMDEGIDDFGDMDDLGGMDNFDF